MFDCNNRKTFTSLFKYYEMYVSNNKKGIVVMVCNKVDLDRKFTSDDQTKLEEKIASYNLQCKEYHKVEMESVINYMFMYDVSVKKEYQVNEPLMYIINKTKRSGASQEVTNKPVIKSDFKKEVKDIIKEEKITKKKIKSTEVKEINKEETRVVKIQRKKTGEIVQDCDVYIGRKITMGGWNLSDSIWGNPFKVGKDGDIKTVLEKYEAHVRKNKKLIDSLINLKGKVLGCWCKKKPDDPCHGDVLVKLINEKKKKVKIIIESDSEDDEEKELIKNKEFDYKFKAECQVDVDKLKKLMNEEFIVTKDESGFPAEQSSDRSVDVDVEFKSDKSIDEIRNIMKKIQDGHVMYESLNYADKYTGDRYYDEDDENEKDENEEA